MAQLLKNNAYSNLAAPMTNVATTLTVTTGQGDRFPVVTAPDYVLLTLQDASNNIEIVKVTARTSGAASMTVERAQEGTTARSWSIGDVVDLRLTAGALQTQENAGTLKNKTWQGNAIGVAYGGTGATTEAGARASLKALAYSETTGSALIPVGNTAQRDATPAPGMFRYNSETSEFEGFQSTGWSSIGGGGGVGSVAVQTFSGTGAQTAFTLNSAPATLQATEVFISGVRQTPTIDYILSGTTLTFLSAPPSGTNNILARWIAGISLYVTVTTETQVASAGQTVFNLSTTTYVPGANNLDVFVNGLRMVSGSDFIETNNTTVTFTSGLTVGDDVVFKCGQTLNEAVDAPAVGYTPSGTGAVATNVQSKLRESVSVKDFGAVGDGVADDTAAIQAAINATKNGPILFFPAGTYYCASTLTVGRGSKLRGENTGVPDPRSLNHNCTKIQFAGGINGVVVDQADLESGYVWGISIENLHFESVVGDNGPVGVNLRKVANSRFKNVGIERFTAGLKITFGMYKTFDSCSFQRCGTTALLMTDEDSVTTTQRFVDCLFRESDWAVQLTTSGSYLMDTVFDHCAFETTNVGGVSVHKGCSVTFIEPYFENVTDAGTSLSGTAIRLYADGTSSRTDTLSVCNIVGGDISGPNTGSGFANALIYVGAGAASVNIIGGLYQRALHGIQVDASCKDRVVNAECPSFVSVTNPYTGTDSQRNGVWPLGVLGASAVTLRNFSGRFGVLLRTDADKIEIRNSGNSSYYTEHSAADTALQEVSTVGAGGASVSYRVRVQNAGTLQEAARFRANGYTKFTATGAFAVPNYVASSADALHQFLSDATGTTLVVSNLNTSASAHCIRTTKPDITNGFHYLASRTDTAANVFQVAANGNVTNTNNSYGAISDIKLKFDIVDASSQWGDVKALSVKKYKLKADPEGPTQIGLIAQEAELVSPGLVEETADMTPVEVDAVDEEGNPIKTIEYRDAGTKTKSVKYSIVNLKMLKALQEAMARIEALEAEVQALKS